MRSLNSARGAQPRLDWSKGALSGKRLAEIDNIVGVKEASGNITLDTIVEVAATGVDYASSGWITHSSPSLDVALDIEI